jgi:hypothetical protein
MFVLLDVWGSSSGGLPWTVILILILGLILTMRIVVWMTRFLGSRGPKRKDK